MREGTTYTEEVPIVYQGLPPGGSGHRHAITKAEKNRRVVVDHFTSVPPYAPLQPNSLAKLGTAHTPTTTKSTIEQNNIYESFA
jgi:hypothetical protein